jgi:hypothetical protein
MSWWLLGVLIAVGLILLWRRHRRHQVDAHIQESIDHLGPHTEAKRPPAKQPWNRPGFGPAPRMDALKLGEGPMPPAAGHLEESSKAGPMPDDDDGTPMPLSIADMPPDTVNPPPPPPPGAVADDDREPTDEPADEPAPASAAEPAAEPPAPSGDRSADTIDLAEIVGIDESDEELMATIRGPRVVELPPELEAEALDLMRRRQEVAAVRLVCDSMGVGILDAQRTVRSLVGR